jgi:uncharacterized protein involved in outer membrane biogenesis
VRKVLIGLLVLVILAVGALAVTPSFIDPEASRDLVLAALRRITGRDVTIEGPLAVALLPAPSLTARDVRVANPPGAGERDLIHIGDLELRVAVAPLLAGRLVFRSVTMADPELDLERLADGRLNLDALPASTSGVGPGASSEAVAPGNSGAAHAVAIERIDITNGRLAYRAAGKVLRIERLDLMLRLAPDGGAARAVGTLQAEGSRLGFTLDAGRIGAHTPVDVKLDLLGTGAQAELDGEAVLTPADARSFAGKLKLSGDNFAALVRQYSLLGRFGSPELGLARRFAVEGDLRGDASEINLEQLALSLDALHGGGALRIVPGTPTRAALDLAFGQVDFDQFTASAATPLATPPTAASPLAAPVITGAGRTPSSPGGGAAAPVANPSAAVGGFGLPDWLSGSIAFGLEGALWHGGILRDLKFQATLDQGALAITRASVQLPGGSDLALSGTIGAAAGAPRFEGVVEANSDNLRQLLDWLGAAPVNVPGDRLRRAVLASRLVATPDNLTIESLDATVDSTRLTGAAVAVLRQRPGFGVRLALDQLNLDAYLPTPPAAPAAASGASPAPAPAAPGNAAALAASPGFLGRFDANLEAAVETLTWQGQPARGIRFSGTLHDGALAVKEAAFADLAGATGTVSGTVEGLAEGTPNWRGTVALKGPDIGHLLRFAGPSLASDRLAGPFVLAGDIEGAPDATALDATLEALGGKLRVSGELRSGAADNASIDLAVEASHPSAAGFARDIVPSYQPAGGDPGALVFAAALRGTPRKIDFSDASLALGAVTVAGEGTLDLTGKRPSLGGSFTFGDLVIDHFLPARQAALRMPPEIEPRVRRVAAATVARSSDTWSRVPFDVAWPAALDLDLTLSGNSLAYGALRIERPALALAATGEALRIDRLSGGLLGGTIEANATLDTGATPRMTLDLALRQAALQEVLGTSRITGRADLDLSLSDAGRSPAELIENLQGSGTISARNGTIAGIDLAALDNRLKRPDRSGDFFELLHGARGGGTRYETIDGSFQISNGVGETRDLHFVADGGEGRAMFAVDLADRLLHGRVEFRLAVDPNAPPFAMRLDGPLGAPDMVFEVNAIERYLQQRAAPSVKAPAP